jgi:hypothetical protein
VLDFAGEPQHLGNNDSSRKTGDAHDDGEHHRLQPIALERRHELRADRVADPE